MNAIYAFFARLFNRVEDTVEETVEDILAGFAQVAERLDAKIDALEAAWDDAMEREAAALNDKYDAEHQIGVADNARDKIGEIIGW